MAAVDLRACAWLHNSIAFDLTLCADSSHPKCEWEERLPNLCRWMGPGGMLAKLRRATTAERRYQLLLAVVMGKQFSTFGHRIPKELTEEVEETRHHARERLASARQHAELGIYLKQNSFVI